MTSTRSQLVKIVKDMRDEKKFQCGEEMDVEPRLFIGAAANPFAAPFDYRPHRLAKKVAAGADFVQTQIVFNVPKFAEYMKRVGDLGLLDDVYVLAGVAPIKSLGAARYMATNVPGMDVPDEYRAAHGRRHRRHSQEGEKGPPRRLRRKRGSTSAQRSSSRYARSPAWLACTLWPSNGKTPCPSSPKEPACCPGR